MQNRYWKFRQPPIGTDFSQALTLESELLPTPADGEVLIKADLLSMDAGTRMWMTQRMDGYQPPLPAGSKMMGLCLGRVVDSCASSFENGQLVRAFGQWADYSLVRPEVSDLRVMDETVVDPRQHFGVLGMNGWTAYVGILETGAAKPGETVLVSAAAGATGMLACQVAKIQGCKVIGLAGGAEKCRFLTDALGIDQAIDYKSADVFAELAKVPGGINVYFDNVGGPLLDAVLPNMAHYGRIALCGLMSDYGKERGSAGPARFDQILMRRLTIQGFFSPDFAARGDAINNVIRGWMDQGKIHMLFDETTGLENLLAAYGKLFTGGNIGKVIVRL
jgi:NADPH-dependent curcumin reductase CurA